MPARALALSLLLALPFPAVAELGLNLYGLAYHFDRERAEQSGLDNEFIAGVGLRYRVPHSERMQWFVDVGAS